MKIKFEKPQIEVISMENENVIVASGGPFYAPYTKESVGKDKSGWDPIPD